MNTQARLKKIADATKARKGKTATASTAPTLPPSVVASPSPSLEIVGDKRGPPEDAEEQGPVKHHRGPGDSSTFDEGLHRLQPGIPAEKFVLPPAFSHGGKMLDGQTKVVVTPADQVILDNMGPASLKNELVDATVAAFKLMEIANFLNGRKCKYLEERDDALKRLKKRGEELHRAREDLREMETNFEAYKDKFALQLELTTTLEQKEEEARKLFEEKGVLEAKVVELEEQLKKLSLVDDEEKEVDPQGEFAGLSRIDLIRRILDGESAMLEVATSSFNNAIAQLQVLNPSPELIVEDLDEYKIVKDGLIVSPPEE